MNEQSKETFAVTSRILKGFQVSNSIRDFDITVDEPVDMGGENKGPTPVEMVLAGLGSCLCIMSRIVAKKMRLRLEEVEVKTEGDLDLRGMKGAEGIRPGFQEVRVQIDLIGELSDQDKEKLIKMVQLTCPVDDSLEHQVEVQWNIA